MVGHKSTGAALSVRALLSEPLDLAAVVHLVELKDGKLDLLLLMLDLLGLGVGLLLALLGTSPEPKNQVQCGFLLDVIVRERAAVLELLPCENQPLLVWWDSLLILDLRLHIVDRIR